MRLVTYLHSTSPHQPRIGALVKDVVVDLAQAAAWANDVLGVAREDLPGTMLGLVQAGVVAWGYAARLVAAVEQTSDPLSLVSANQSVVTVPVSAVRLLPPIQPVTLRDAYAFEQHVKKANENRGRSVPEAWYQFPIFYYNNPFNLFGAEADVPYPRYTRSLDFELEIAAVLGASGKDMNPADAAAAIFGYTIFNDWSARDVQQVEMKAGLGPAKGKDFAASLGPCIITVDELEANATGRPGVYDLAMIARVNGVEISHGNFKDIYWSFGEIIAHASEECALYPGEVIGSGTVGTGCLLEITKAAGPWLQPGDVVELEIEKIGVLRNVVAAKE